MLKHVSCSQVKGCQSVVFVYATKDEEGLVSIPTLSRVSQLPRWAHCCDTVGY